MAEAAAVSDSESRDDGSNILQRASLFLKKKAYTVKLTPTHFSWTAENGKEHDPIRIRVCDIVAVNQTTPSDGKADTEQSAKLTVVYVTQQKKFVLKRQEATFTGDPVKCKAMCDTVQNILNTVTDRPRKLLVMINPASGSKKGPSAYKNKVAPIFAEANVEADVHVTEKAHHSEEILAAYDLKSIDGIVLVSGDGLYHEYANGIVRRMAADAGADINDPEFVPSEFPVPVGIIPCGTGNGIARTTVGNWDIQSAAYTIVLGFRTRNNLMSVFSGKDLVAFANLLVAYGFWSDMIYVAEQRRNLGKLRYLFTTIEILMIKKCREMNLNIEYKCGLVIDEVNKENLKKYFKKPDDGHSPSIEVKSEVKETNEATEDGTIDKTEKRTQEVNTEEAIDPVLAKTDDLKAADDGSGENVESDADSKSQVATVSVPMDNEIDGVEERIEHTRVDDSGKDEACATNINSAMIGMDQFSGTFVGSIAMCSVDFGLNSAGEEDSKLDPRLRGALGVTAVLTNQPCGRMELSRMLMNMAFNPGFVVTNPPESLSIFMASEWKISLNNAASDPDSDLGRKEHVLNVDGEHYTLKIPEYHVRLFPHRIPLFSNMPYITGRGLEKK